jgi:hypothetical protein
MTPGHHLLLHLKNPRIRYPVSRKPAGSPADRDRGIRASIILSATGQDRMPIRPAARWK